MCVSRQAPDGAGEHAAGRGRQPVPASASTSGQGSPPGGGGACDVASGDAVAEGREGGEHRREVVELGGKLRRAAGGDELAVARAHDALDLGV
jgi:hypothetical protein